MVEANFNRSLSFPTYSLLTVLIVIIATAVIVQRPDLDRPTVSLPSQGTLVGQTWFSHTLQRPFAAFMAVPFAKPPVGDLRFSPPEPPEPWEGIRDATRRITPCPQMTFEEVTAGEEDCLQLNVFTHNLENKSEKSPVLVFIHGGGFFTGDADVAVYGPDYLMDEDVVLVSTQYRLGPLGFLTLGDDSIQSNLGVRDLIRALEWVRDNIAHFGGDPNRVTVMGQSAGAILASYLMLAPQAKGLFHSVIALSGNSLSSYQNWDKHPHLYGRRLAKELGCDPDQMSNEEVVECLRKLPAVAFPEQTQFFLHYPWTGPNIWKPAVDLKISSGPVLPDDPESLFRQGKYSKVPILTGITRDEGAFHLGGSFRGINKFSEKHDRWDELGPLILFHRSLDEIDETDIQLAREVRDFYMGEIDIGHINDVDEFGVNNNTEALTRFARMMGDPFYLAPLYKLNKIMLEQEDAPEIYQYVFSHSGGPLSSADAYTMPTFYKIIKIFARKLFGWRIFDRGLGVAHADEMTMLFRPHVLPFASKITAEDEAVGSAFAKLIANFAKYRNPTPAETDNWSNLTQKWFSLNDLLNKSPGNWNRYLDITPETDKFRQIKVEDLEERATFWQDILRRLSVLKLSDKPVLTREEYERLLN